MIDRIFIGISHPRTPSITFLIWTKKSMRFGVFEKFVDFLLAVHFIRGIHLNSIYDP